MNTTLTKFYRVRKEKQVTFKVTIGNAQIGATTLIIDKEEKLHKKLGSFVKRLGVGQTLNGKSMLCTTVISNVRTETNEASVTYELSGGHEEFRETLQQTVKGQGDVAFFTAYAEFYK